MENSTFKKIISHALNDLKREINRNQTELMMYDKFGDDAVANPLFSDPADYEKQRLLRKHTLNQLRDDLVLYTDLQRAYDNMTNDDFQAGIDEILKDFKSQL